ncbi:MAG: F0F1 ATP synthase subunit B [Candidatus Omnitrophica bacterium]|nr:F0F1 ATP synthase subunit B [Candidatus Omnitrophota bacterium]
MELLKLLSTSAIVAQIVSFLILLFLLRIFFWKQVLKLLDERKERIASEFKRIEEAKAEIERIRSGYEEKLRSIEATARIEIQEAIEEGQNAAKEIKKSAKVEAESIVNEAKAEAIRELLKAKNELKGYIADLVLDATGRLLEEEMTGEKDKRLVEDFINRIDGLK